ncbi:MAG: helix-turn-helix domain-containing protein [Nanoarchaeota archaeon]
MWTAKIRLLEQEGVFRKFAVKHNVTMAGYPVSSHKVGNFMQTTISGIVYGTKDNKRNCLNELANDKRVIFLESSGDFFIIVIKESMDTYIMYDPLILYIKPVMLYPTGEYIVEIASWKRSKIEKLLHFLKKHRIAELLKFKKEKIKNISIVGVLPELTDKQKEALNLAIKSGYYNYPRKIELRDLAKQMKSSLSTYREHLRIAEKKVMPNNL